ncbi:agamous-like MADS-box protein AGL11 [Primulina huaijiensis]|uniref:agamous-like MADS-box protein AGL11 n=1 Tax=Primulina huaijiensis TaxID=1492673 RepID=UPI003CC6F364
MGRAKLNMELIIKEKSRSITFKKRKEGLIRKIKEFTTLCAVEACMIIYGPKQDKVSTDPEFWPENIDEMRRIIDIHKAKNKDSGNKSYGLSDFFHDRRKKIEDELSKLRKKNMEARFPTWIDFMNCLTEAQLREFAANLRAKYEHIRATVHLKRSKEVFDVNLTDFGGLNPSQNQSFYNPGMIQRGNIEFEVINQPAISSMKPMHCPDLDHNQELHSMNQHNSMTMLMLSDSDHCMQFGGASTSGNISFKHQVFYESTAMDPMIGHSPRTSLPRFYAPQVAPSSYMMPGLFPMQIQAAAVAQQPFFTRESLDDVDLMQYQMRGTGPT